MEKKKLKQEYNQYMIRNKKAEEYFKTRTIQECLDAVDLFNEITKKLSNLRTELEVLINRPMTEKEIWNGFDVDD